MNKNLRNYFHWVNSLMEYEEGYEVNQPRYLMEAFNRLSDVNWNIDAAAILARINEKERFPELLDLDKENLQHHLGGLNEKKHLDDDMKVVRFLRYLSIYMDGYSTIHDRDIPREQLDYKKAVDAYHDWKSCDYQPPFLASKSVYNM